MRRDLATLMVAAGTVFACGSATQGASPAITVAVQGVRVVKPPPDGDDMLRAFNAFSGTAVALLASEPQGGLVLFDPDASRIKSFTDDKGKDLKKGPRARPSPRYPKTGSLCPDHN